jgi:hypothetical protein
MEVIGDERTNKLIEKLGTKSLLDLHHQDQKFLVSVLV